MRRAIADLSEVTIAGIGGGNYPNATSQPSTSTCLHRMPTKLRAIEKTREPDLKNHWRALASSLRAGSPHRRPRGFRVSLEKLVVRVAASLKVVAMIVDDRLLQGTAPWHSFMRPGGERKAAPFEEAHRGRRRRALHRGHTSELLTN